MSGLVNTGTRSKDTADAKARHCIFETWVNRLGGGWIRLRDTELTEEESLEESTNLNEETSVRLVNQPPNSETPPGTWTTWVN